MAVKTRQVIALSEIGIRVNSNEEGEGNVIPQMSVEDAYEYLGISVTRKGAMSTVKIKLARALDQISRAPLKPFQRLWILKIKLFPAVITSLCLRTMSVDT